MSEINHQLTQIDCNDENEREREGEKVTEKVHIVNKSSKTITKHSKHYFDVRELINGHLVAR